MTELLASPTAGFAMLGTLVLIVSFVAISLGSK